MDTMVFGETSESIDDVNSPCFLYLYFNTHKMKDFHSLVFSKEDLEQIYILEEFINMHGKLYTIHEVTGKINNKEISIVSFKDGLTALLYSKGNSLSIDYINSDIDSYIVGKLNYKDCWIIIDSSWENWTACYNQAEDDYVERIRQRLIDNITEEEKQHLEECAIRQADEERVTYIKEAKERRRNQFLYDFSRDDSSLNPDFW